MSAPPPTVPSVLLPELIGFVPQFLLDDIINIANDATRQTVDAMEAFLERRDAARTDPVDDWKSTEELEKGLNSFQTLLESHVDIAFDFFEAWSLRNIFAVPADLPVVAPHQKGLNLEQPEGREAELIDEIKELRKKLEAHRKLRRLYTRAVRASAAQLARSRRRLEKLSFLRAPQLQALIEMPNEFQAMYNSVSVLPPMDASHTAIEPVAVPEPGKRQWETNKTGYLNWAVEQLMQRAKEQAKGEGVFSEGSSAVGAATAAAYSVASAQDVKALLELTAPESNFKRFVEVGRVVLLKSGPHAGHIAVIAEIIDHNRAIVDGPTTGVPRQSFPYRHLSLTPLALTKLPRGAGSGVIQKQLEKEATVERWNKSSWAQKRAAIEKRRSLNDFERFAVMLAKKARRDTVRKSVAKASA
ncbi:uncharacterized protein FIBRA_03399 [Fibroporia radiculosa]|uniref:KOW domain-containing protein n=1 Tax=Fibroporia radiculosa TaxID=599839 RepID=J4H2D8_9APHY|nr:uncharacterized protein FIBRA_03399 [Fibroporia radiculosa]CCM01349.1 predicted protein [Fibroporia radiculosa]